MEITCFPWNTAKRRSKAEHQAKLILHEAPDIIALQEILPSTEILFREYLASTYPF
jgi:exonuclease III